LRGQRRCLNLINAVEQCGLNHPATLMIDNPRRVFGERPYSLVSYLHCQSILLAIFPAKPLISGIIVDWSSKDLQD